jgi:hypothetical protein
MNLPCVAAPCSASKQPAHPIKPICPSTCEKTLVDHESEEARTKAAQLLLKQLPIVSQGLPTIVVGEIPAHQLLSRAINAPLVAGRCDAYRIAIQPFA